MRPWHLKPARDLGLSLPERLTSHRRESGPVSTFVRMSWWAFGRAYMRLFHSLDVIGGENVPRDRAFVLIANHASHLDAIALTSALSRQSALRCFALGAGDTFFVDVPRSLLSVLAVNALPVWRGRTRRQHLETLRTRLIEDECAYVLFPEGTRSRDGTMGSFKTGLVGSLVVETDIPVIPCAIEGAYQAMPPGRRLPRRRPISLRIGAPMIFADAPDDKSGWSQVSRSTEAAVRALLGETKKGA